MSIWLVLSKYLDWVWCCLEFIWCMMEMLGFFDGDLWNVWVFIRFVMVCDLFAEAFGSDSPLASDFCLFSWDIEFLVCFCWRSIEEMDETEMSFLGFFLPSLIKSVVDFYAEVIIVLSFHTIWNFFLVWFQKWLDSDLFLSSESKN